MKGERSTIRSLAETTETPKQNLGLRGVLLRAAFAACVIAFCAAPVPGDGGGCGKDPVSLDGPRFFESKKALDCARCRECNVRTRTCDVACDYESQLAELPRGCDPVEHDGDVCIRRLLDAGCEEYRTYLRDDSPETPTECNFCPRGGQ
jgi:hypothetical protein